jgi:hypothetical protein
MNRTFNNIVWGSSAVCGLALIIGSLPTISANVVGASNTNFTLSTVIGFAVVIIALALFVLNAPKEESPSNLP